MLPIKAGGNNWREEQFRNKPCVWSQDSHSTERRGTLVELVRNEAPPISFTGLRLFGSRR